MSDRHRRRTFLPYLAALASAVPIFRPGTSVPASTPPYAAAPPEGATQFNRRDVSRLRRSLRASTTEGMFAEVVTSCAGGAVLTGWALHLGFTPLLVGVLGALPFLSQLVQFPSAWLTTVSGHRRVAIWAVAASRQVLLVLVPLPFLPVELPFRQNVFLAVAAATAVLGVVGNNAWVAWMGDLVPQRMRGRYFGKRTALCTAAGTASALLAGLLLDGAQRIDAEGVALATLALVGYAAGIATTVLMSRQHDPIQNTATKQSLSWRAILQPLRDPAVRPVLAFQVVWNAAIGVAATFYAVHMLQNLKMGFTLVAIHGTAHAFTRIVVAPLWGRALDRVGSRPVLVACSFGITVIPLVWLFPTNAWLWPLAFEPILSGSLWGGHALATFQLPLKVAPRENRAFYLASFAMAGGISFAFASAAGGWILESIPDALHFLGTTFSPIHVLFLLSTFCRAFAASLALRITEPGSRSVDDLWQLVWSGVQSRASSLGIRTPDLRS